MRANLVVALLYPAAVAAWGWVPPKFSSPTPYTPESGKFHLNKSAKYQMPVTFGETLKLPQQIKNWDVEIIEARFSADAASLLPFIPKQLELIAPVVKVTFKQYKNITWLSSRGDNQIVFSVPVRYTSSSGTVTEGDFTPVVWSSSMEAIQAFRESVNLPFNYANISYDGRAMEAKWDYTTFLTLEHDHATPEAVSAQHSNRTNLLSWGYFPSAVGETPRASISQLTLLPSDVSIVSSEVPCTIKWQKPGTTPGEPAPGYDAMPTEWRIVNTIVALAVDGEVHCVSRSGSESLRYDLASVLYDNMAPMPELVRDGVFGKWEEQPSTIYRMPVTFGGDYSPSVGPAYYPDGVSLWIQHMTDAEALLPYVPSGLKLLSPQVTIVFSRSYNVGWLANRSYDMILVMVPVSYTYPNGTEIEAQIDIVVWESCWEGCLITGREMSGVPKIYADTVYDNGTMVHGVTTKTMSAAWGGIDFLRLSATLPEPTPLPPSNMTLGHGFQWKYFPAPADGTKAQISQLTDYPSDARTTSQAIGSGCEVKWLPGHPGNLSFEEMPTQHVIINALANLPVRGSPACGLSHSESILRNDLSAVIVDNFMIPEHDTLYV